MARQQFYQPHRRNNRDDGVYDDTAAQAASSHASSASSDAQNTVDNIDDVLRQNEENASLHNPQGAEGGSSGFFNPNDAQGAKSVNSAQLAGAEGLAAGGNFTFSPEGDPKRTGFKNLVRTRLGKRSIAGGIISLFVGAGLLIGLPALGPLELIHLSETLGKSLHSMDSASSNRLGKMFGHALDARSVSETRLSMLGKQIFRPALENLKALGIEYQTDGAGFIKTGTINTDNLSERFPELKNMGPDEARSFLTEQFGLQEGTLSPGTGKIGKVNFSFDARSMGMKATAALLKNHLSLLDNGTIVSAMTKRAVFVKAFGLPSIFHPFNLKNGATQKLTTISERATYNRNRIRSEITDPLKERVSTARTALKDKLGGSVGKFVAGILVTQAALCTVRGAADAAVAYNHAAIVEQSAVQAMGAVAVGAQNKDGANMSIEQDAAVGEGLVDKDGQTVWQARALQAEEGVSNPSGPDLPSVYTQAFSSKTTADNIRNAIRINLPGTGLNVTDAACSKFGIVLSGLVTIGEFIVNIPDGETGGFALYAGQRAATTVAMGGVVYFFQHELTNILQSGAVVPDILSGPEGGNLLAYGAREAGNMGARAVGGVELSQPDSDAIALQLQQEDQQQFQSQGLFARIFDVYDYRSLVGSLVQSIRPSFMGNIASMSNGLLTFGSAIPHIFSSLIPHAQAANKPYDWGFPLYGIPSDVLNDPSLDNPYANGDKVAAILDKKDSTSQGYIDRAQKCFGVTISQVAAGSGSQKVWDVIPGEGDPVNTASRDYTDAHCNDMSDSNWKRIVMFVFDTNTMKATACYEGDDQSCTDIGMNATTSSSTAPSPVGQYENPLRDVKNVGPARIDEGVDYTGDGPVYAIGNGTVTYASASTGWPGGTYISYTLSDGPAAGKTVYVAENCTNIQVQKGDTVSANTVLCTMHNSYPWIETGWSESGLDLALAHDVYQEGHATAYGVNFDGLMKKLGAPAGTYDHPGETPEGALPPEWPSW